MNHHNTEKAEQLYDAIGMLDDKIIAEAQSPIAARTAMRREKRRVALLAVAAMLAVVLTGGAFRSFLRLQPKPSKSPHTDQSTQGDATPSSPIELDAILASAAPQAMTLQKEEINLHDGTMKLIWQENGATDYRCITFTDSGKQSTLKNAMRAEGTQKLTSEPQYRIWICYPDATVLSPHLANTPGNVGFGNLFSYRAEVLPTKNFTETVNKLLH